MGEFGKVLSGLCVLCLSLRDVEPRFVARNSQHLPSLLVVAVSRVKALVVARAMTICCRCSAVFVVAFFAKMVMGLTEGFSWQTESIRSIAAALELM